MTYIEEKIDVDVGLYIDQYQMRQIHSRSGFCLLGIFHTWNIETGLALAAGAETTFKSLFTNVEMIEDVNDFANRPLTILITPRIESFNVSGDLSAELLLHCKLVDDHGVVVYENTIPSVGESQASTGFIFGFWGGKMALSKTSVEAFNMAFSMLASDIIEKVDFTPYLSAE
jgi:hypothetical protein